MNIYVGNLPWSIDDASLEQIFAEHGTITSAKVITDRQTCLLYTSPSPRDVEEARMPSSA